MRCTGKFTTNVALPPFSGRCIQTLNYNFQLVGAKIAAITRAVKKGFLFNEGPFVKELDKTLQGFALEVLLLV